MVSEQGTVKVLDFGIVRRRRSSDPTEGDPTEGDSIEGDPNEVEPELTTDNGPMGTPAYMAPEQFETAAVDALADQFSYCVALWEALYGERPFQGETLPALMTAVREGRRREPSTSSTVPAWVRAIVQRGLSLDPAARWPSMRELLDALRRDPAVARQRWVRRVGALGLIVLAGLGGWSWWRARTDRCSGAQARLEGVWDDVRRDAVREAMLGTGTTYADAAWTRVHTRLDDYAGQWVRTHVDACEATTVRGEQSAAVMDLRMACLGRARQQLDAAVELLADADGAVVARAHDVLRGLPDLDRCREVEALLADVEPPDAAEAAEVTRAREHLATAQAAREAARLDTALAAAREAEELVSSLRYPPVHVEVGLELGRIHDARGSASDAERVLVVTLARATELGQLHDMQRAATLLLQVVGQRGARPAEARQRYELLAQTLPVAAPADRADAAMNLGTVLYVAGEYDAAEAELQRAVELAGEADAPLLATAISALGAAHMGQGEYAAARAEFGRAHGLLVEALGAGHPDAQKVRSNLALASIAQGDPSAAEAELRQSLELSVAALGPEHPEVATLHNNLGYALLLTGRGEESAEQFARAVEILQAARAPDHPDLATILGNQATATKMGGHSEEALAIYRRSLAANVEAFGGAHPNVGLVLNNIGDALARLNRHEEAELEYRRALEISETALGNDHPRVATVLGNLAITLNALDRVEEADDAYRRAVALRVRTLGPSHSDTLSTRGNYAEYLGLRDRWQEAVALAEAILADAQVPPATDADRWEAAFRVARFLVRQQPDQASRARALAERALALCRAANQPRAEAIAAWLQDNFPESEPASP